MHLKHLKYLRCPKSGTELTLVEKIMEDGRVKEGKLVSQDRITYPIMNFIPRFVSGHNYADNFGFEWQVHSRTQFDADAKHKMSEDRGVWCFGMGQGFIRRSDFGSGFWFRTFQRTSVGDRGDGGFVLIILKPSSPIMNQTAIMKTFCLFRQIYTRCHLKKLLLIRCFASVCCSTHLTRMHHFTLWRLWMKPGAKLATDIYLKTVMRYYLNTRYWVRPLTRNIQSEKLYAGCKAWINLMWPLARIIRKIPKVGEAINWRLLIADYSNQMPDADDDTLKEWAYLDTFDMLSPAFDIPASPATFQRWHEEAGLHNIHVRLGPNGVVGTAEKITRLIKDHVWHCRIY